MHSAGIQMSSLALADIFEPNNTGRAVIYNIALVILDLSSLSIEKKTQALYFSYNLCICDVCQNQILAHINIKNQIRISKKYFQKKMNASLSGIFEIIFTIIYFILIGIFPEHDDEKTLELTKKLLGEGIKELPKIQFISS